MFLPEQLVVNAEEFAEQQQREKALEQDARIAKEFDLSVEEYRSQNDYIDRANSNRDTCQRDFLSGYNDCETGFVAKEPHNPEIREEKELVGSVVGDGTMGGRGSTGSAMNLIHSGQPLSQKQIEKALLKLKPQVEASNHEDVHSSYRQLERVDTMDSFVNISSYSYSSLSSDFDGPSSLDDNRFIIGSLVCVPIKKSRKSLHGVVMWIGTLPDLPGTITGVELVRYHNDIHWLIHTQEEPLTGCNDGTWQGRRYFKCLPGMGFFCPLKTLKQVLKEDKLNRKELISPQSVESLYCQLGWYVAMPPKYQWFIFCLYYVILSNISAQLCGKFTRRRSHDLLKLLSPFTMSKNIP